MSTRPIRPGDLVCVVRGRCLCARGRIFRVEQLCVPDGLVCRPCAITRIKPVVARSQLAGLNVPVEWCERIPPLSELDSTDSEQHAPTEVTA